VEERIIEEFGTKCDTYEEGCATCLVYEALEAERQKCEEMVDNIIGGAFARCNELRIEIENQEEEHGIADRSTIDRLSEAEKNYAELKEATTQTNNPQA